jgi:hypothetical protein
MEPLRPDVRDQIDPALKAKIERSEPLTPEESLAVKVVCDLGDTCGCDDDHHRRDLNQAKGQKRITFCR